MDLLTTLFRSWGNDRALANARIALEAEKREVWLVRGLSRRLDRLPGPAMRPAAVRVAS